MKVLFVDLLLKYINPTRSLIPQLFSTMETRFFGPGYVSSDCLSAGLASFIEKNGPFDVVVVSEHIAFSKINNFVNTYQAFRKNYAIEFPKTELRETEKLFEAVKKLNICKVIITLESDYYNFTPGHISVVDNYFDFVYIDANHDYDSILKDLKAWFPKVKNKGILFGDDYNRPYGVSKAVAEFAYENKLIVHFTDNKSQFYLIKE